MTDRVWTKSQSSCRREIAPQCFRLSTIFTFTSSKKVSDDQERELLGRKNGQSLWTIQALIERSSIRPPRCLSDIQQLTVREIYQRELENQRDSFDPDSRSADGGQGAAARDQRARYDG